MGGGGQIELTGLSLLKKDSKKIVVSASTDTSTKVTMKTTAVFKKCMFYGVRTQQWTFRFI